MHVHLNTSQKYFPTNFLEYFYLEKNSLKKNHSETSNLICIKCAKKIICNDIFKLFYTHFCQSYLFETLNLVYTSQHTLHHTW